MGLYSSTTTTSTKTAPLSERGQEYDSLLKQLMMENLQQFGNYNVTPKTTTKYQDEGRATDLQQRIADIDAKISQRGTSNQRGVVTPGGGLNRYLQGGVAGSVGDPLQAQRDSLQRELDGIPKTTFQDYDLTKKEDPRVEAARQRFGEGSPEVQKAREQVSQDEYDKQENLAGIQKNYLQSLNKLVSGDYSYTPEQEKQIDAYIAPVRDVIKRTTDELLSTYSQSDKELRSALGDVSKEIDKTGFALDDALKAASVQYDQSGTNLMSALKTANESSRNRAKFEFDLLSQQADQQAAQQGALLGLPPGSQSEKAAALKTKTDALKQIELELNEKETAGALNIQQGVEQGKQNISLARVNIASSQGAKKEQVAQSALGLTELFTNKKEGALATQANAQIQLEQSKQNLLYGAGYGNLGAQVAAGQNGLAFQQNSQASQAALQQGLLAPITQQLGVEQQRQFAEATTTQKQNKSFFDVLQGLAGIGASVAGGVFGLGGGGGGGGGGTPAAAPVAPPINITGLFGGTNAGTQLGR